MLSEKSYVRKIFWMKWNLTFRTQMQRIVQIYKEKKSKWMFVDQKALRVLPAETWLAVYRWSRVLKMSFLWKTCFVLIFVEKFRNRPAIILGISEISFWTILGCSENAYGRSLKNWKNVIFFSFGCDVFGGRSTKLCADDWVGSPLAALTNS